MNGILGKRRLKALGVVLILVVAPVGYLQVSQPGPPDTADPQPTWANRTFDGARAGAQLYNARVDDVYRANVWGLDLGNFRGFLANQRVNVYVVDRDGGTAAFSFRVDGDGEITELRQEPRDDATVRVVTNRSTVHKIGTEYTHTRALKHSFVSGDIRVDGVGPINAVEWYVVVKWIKFVVGNADGGGGAPS